MNKFVKVLLIIAACLAGLGVLVTAFGVYWSVRVADRLLPDEAVEQTLAVDVAALRDVRIDTGVCERPRRAWRRRALPRARWS